MDFRGNDFFIKNGYNSADIVYGADHGIHEFCAFVKLIIWNSNSIDVNPLSIVITVANIDCDKENRAIVDKTIAKPTNDGLRRVFGKCLNLYFNAFGNAVTIGDEVSTPEIQAPINCLIFEYKNFCCIFFTYFRERKLKQ
jgi:hypothetical protein